MSVEEIRKGVWAVRWREGGRNRKRVVGRKRDAEAYDAEVKRRKRLGELGIVDASRETLADFVEDWWRLYARPNLEQSTLDWYAWLWDTHIVERLGDYRLLELTPELLERWRSDLARAGVGPAIAAKALVLLQGVLQRAVEWGRLPQNPARLVRRPRQVDRPAIEPLGPGAIEAIRSWLIARRRVEDATLVSLLAYAGLRPGEALGLTWGRVRERTLLIEQTASAGGLKPSTKTRVKRSVKLLGPLAADLAEFRLASGRPPDGTLIFPKRHGQAWCKGDLNNWRRRWLSKGAEAVNVTCTPYTLRHSFASLLIWEGHSITYVAAQLGHSPAMTLRTYAHVIDELEGADRVPAEVAIRRARDALARRAAV